MIARTTRRVAAKFGSSLPRSSLKFLRQELERLLEKVQKRSERIADLEKELADRKSTRLNSSHSQISYAVFCLKKKMHSLTSQRACGLGNAFDAHSAFRRGHAADMYGSVARAHTFGIGFPS